MCMSKTATIPDIYIGWWTVAELADHGSLEKFWLCPRTSRKRAIGWSHISPLVPVYLRTGTKGCTSTGSRAQGSSAGSIGAFSTGSWYEPVLKVFAPKLPQGWGLRCNFSTGSWHQPVLKPWPAYFFNPRLSQTYLSISSNTFQIIYLSLSHSNKSPFFSTILLRLAATIHPRVSNIILSSGVPNLAHFL